MKRTLIIAAVFFVLLGVIGLSLKKVEMKAGAESDYRIELADFELKGYQDNQLTYKLTAKKARANRNTDYLHIDQISGTINSSNIEISADKSILSLYSVLFMNSVRITLNQQEVRLETNQLNYSFLSGEIQLPRQSTINIKDNGRLLIDRSTLELKKNAFKLNSVSWQSADLQLSSTKGNLTLDPLELEFSEGVQAKYINQQQEVLEISAEKLLLVIDSGDFSIKDNIQIQLKNKKAFAEKGYFNSKKRSIILLQNAYIIEGNKRLNANKIRIDTNSYSMEAFDSVEAVVDLD